jgi:hypothetical protein
LNEFTVTLTEMEARALIAAARTVSERIAESGAPIPSALIDAAKKMALAHLAELKAQGADVPDNAVELVAAEARKMARKGRR